MQIETQISRVWRELDSFCKRRFLQLGEPVPMRYHFTPYLHYWLSYGMQNLAKISQISKFQKVYQICRRIAAPSKGSSKICIQRLFALKPSTKQNRKNYPSLLYLARIIGQIGVISMDGFQCISDAKLKPQYLGLGESETRSANGVFFISASRFQRGITWLHTCINDWAMAPQSWPKSHNFEISKSIPTLPAYSSALERKFKNLYSAFVRLEPLYKVQ